MYIVDDATDSRIHEVTINGTAASYTSAPGNAAHYGCPVLGLDKVKTWEKGERSKKAIAALREKGWICEIVPDFDLAAGRRRYVLATWPQTLDDGTMRRVTRAASLGLAKTNP